MEILVKLSRLRRNEKVQQGMVLYLVSVLNILIGIFATLFLTRMLGPIGYGDYSLIISVFAFCQIFFLFGFPHSGAHLLVRTNDTETAREYYAAELVILAGLSLLMGVALLAYALVDVNLKEKGLSRVFVYSIPVASIFLLTTYFEVLLPASNKVMLLARSRLWPKLIYLFGLIVLYLASKASSYVLAITFLLYVVSFLVAYGIVIKEISPLFRNLKVRLAEINNANRSFGFHVYVGSLFAVASSGLTGILISYFGTDNVGVGHFALASSLCAPLSLIPNILATIYFREFAGQKKIDSKVILYTLMPSVFCILFVWLVAKEFVLLLYGYNYLPVVHLIYILSIGYTLYGISDLINRFLGAHGQGVALRNSSLVVGLFLLLANVSLIKSFNEEGAVYARVVGGLSYLLCMFFYYKRYTKKIMVSRA